jgi:hypothetical protein
MRRVFGQLSLADGLVARRSGSLEQIAGVLDWGSLAALMRGVQAAPVGRPGYGPVVLLRCVLLQQWYGLSDPALEEALSDRLSFRHFVGLSLSDPVPDHSTLSRFRKVLVEQQLGERLLAEVNRQLEAKGLILKRGTLVDATDQNTRISQSFQQLLDLLPILCSYSSCLARRGASTGDVGRWGQVRRLRLEASSASSPGRRRGSPRGH